jgi:beta-mannanase
MQPFHRVSLGAAVRRSLRPVLAAAILSGVFGGYSAVSTPQTPAQAAGNPIYWGAYLDGAPFNLALIDQFETDAGKHQSIVHWGQPWSMNGSMQSFQTAQYENVRMRGSIPMVDWGSWALGGGINQPNYQLVDITNGTYDAYITQWATAAKAWGHPFFLRYDHEMNGNWFSWSERVNGNQPGDFARAWKHTVDIFRAVGANNVTWVWSPNLVSATTTPLSVMYPGDSYVDWTAMDGYNWGTDKNNKWYTFNQVFGLNPWTKHSTYNDIAALAPSKPMMIAETATSKDGGDGGAWITDTLTNQLPNNFPLVKALVWFNWDAGDPPLDWEI